MGTLIHPSPSVAQAYWTIGRRFGSRLTVAEVGERFDREFGNSFSNNESANLTSNEQIERARWQQIVDRVLEDVSDREQCFAEVHRHFSEPSAWKLFQDVPATIDQLREAGYKLAIASNFDDRLHEVTDGYEDLRQFDAVLTSAELGFRKPSVRFYAELSGRLEVSVDQMWMVGDHPLNDVEAARAAGVRAVLIDRDDRHETETSRIRSLTELLSCVSHEIPDRAN